MEMILKCKYEKIIFIVVFIWAIIATLFLWGIGRRIKATDRQFAEYRERYTEQIDTISTIRTGLGTISDSLKTDGNRLSDIAEKLRIIAEKVEELENIIDSAGGNDSNSHDNNDTSMDIEVENEQLYTE